MQYYRYKFIDLYFYEDWSFRWKVHYMNFFRNYLLPKELKELTCFSFKVDPELVDISLNVIEGDKLNFEITLGIKNILDQRFKQLIEKYPDAKPKFKYSSSFERYLPQENAKKYILDEKIEILNKVVNNEIELFDIREFADFEKHESLNKRINSELCKFFSRKTNIQIKETDKFYNLLFSGENGWHSQDLFSRENVKNYYLSAKEHPMFCEMKDFHGLSESEIYKQKDSKEETFDPFASEYIFFLFLISFKTVINLEIFYESEQQNGKNIPDFRFFKGKQRIGISLKRQFFAGKKRSLIGSKFYFEDDKRIDEVNGVIFCEKRFDNIDEIINYKIDSNHENDKNNIKLNKVICFVVDKMFLKGNRETQEENLKKLFS